MVRMGFVVTVTGSVGGIGTSTMAHAMALQLGPGSLLVDAQTDGLPLDVLVGAEAATGARWSQVHIRSAALSAADVAAALPEHHGLRILSADATTVADAAAIGYLVEVVRATDAHAVIDVPGRHPGRQALHPDLDLMLITPTLQGIVAAQHALAPDTVVVAVDTGGAQVTATRAAEHLGRDVLGPVRWQRGVSLAATAGRPVPENTDLMRMAAHLVAGLTDAH